MNTLENTTKSILAIAELFDNARERIREILPPGQGSNTVLTTLGDAERRAVRAVYATATDDNQK